MPEIEARWQQLSANTAFIGGAEVEALENQFGEYLGGVGCVGVANGTDAIVLALKALRVEPGDEVVVPAYTFIATAAAVILAGATPVFADVEPGTLNLDPVSLESCLTDQTVGVIGVHLYGRPFDLESVGAICRDRGLWLIEDAAQAHGAYLGSKRVGNSGLLATWSFYPSKNLGCFGDGGAVTATDREVLDRVRLLGNHGRTEHYEHAEIGTNSRLDALQAAVLIVRLKTLDDDNARRREIAARYRRGLETVGEIEILQDPPDTQAVYHQMTLLTSQRDALRTWLVDRGVGTGIHYPTALHRQPALESYGQTTSLAVSERAAEQVLCLPMFSRLTDDEVDNVVQGIVDFF